jgi:hypothetical protein
MTVPQEGWQYLVQATGTLIKTRNFAMLYPMISKHCKANNLPVPAEQDVINYMCANLFIPCYEGQIPLMNKWSMNIPRPRALGSCCKEINVAPLPKETI